VLRAASLLLSAIGCSIVIAFGLTVLSEMTLGRAPVEDQSRPNSRAVFSLDYGSRLNDENLVDYMATLRLSTGIRMIDWVDPFLYIRMSDSLPEAMFARGIRQPPSDNGTTRICRHSLLFLFVQ